MKKNLTEVPDVWICEACTSTDDIVSPKYGREEEFLDSFGVAHHEVLHSGTPGEVCADPGRQVSSKKLKVETGKVKFLPTEEVIRLSSGGLKTGRPGHSNTGLKYGPSSSIGPMSRRTSSPSKILTPKFFVPGVKANPSVKSSAFMKSPSHVGAEINTMLGRHAVKRSKESKGKTFHVIGEPENFAVEEQDALKFQSKLELYRQYRPALKATWTLNLGFQINNNTSMGGRQRVVGAWIMVKDGILMFCLSNNLSWWGGFKFFDTAQMGSFYGGFLAQLPRSVHPKVFEFSKKLPKILQVRLLQRDHIWADLFGNDYPDFPDVALYFFPSANIERSKRNNSCLFDILEIRKSVMICYVDGVELLIFTSKQLDEDSQSELSGFLNSIPSSFIVEEGIVARLDTKYFLWGVFRDVKSNHILHESHRELPSLVSAMEYVCDGPAAMDNAEVTDMVVDMEGGKIVGPVDVVVSKELYGKACGSHEKGDVNPATETMLSEPKQGQKSFEKIHRPNSRSIEEKVGVVDEGVINHVKKENMGLLGVSGAAFEASSPHQLQRPSEDSKLTTLQEHHKEPERDEAYDPLAAFSPPLAEKGNQRGPEVRTEVNDDENPPRTWEKKELEVEAERKLNISVCWMPPTNWVKLNIEGSSSRVQGSAGAGGIVRDESGKWILGYSKNLGTSNSLASELWALYHGLNLVWERGFRKVLVECNSHEAVKCLELPTSFLDPNRALILSCKEYLCRNWDCKLQLILREANSCANWLAAHCENQPLGSLAVFDAPPYALAPIFQKDSTGIVQTRSH
ncbi:RNase H domain-containing protein [Citrus sinensis]|uniref:RNase H domain-containing protein n=1 Tax=Citrus sinensis TaxID=2711 RepID=A0ACB8LY99_CITSI|nr:RNase H domain-containing protein [Citrus sinensis]